jgi:integrase
MPYQREDSPVWWVSYTDPSGKRVRRTTGTTNKKEAEALEAKWKLEVHQALKWGIALTHTFDELMLQYLKEVERRSAERDHYNLKNLYPFFTGRVMEELSASDVREYINHRRVKGVGPATINREIGLLSAAINHAKREWEWVLPNPVEGRRLSEPSGRVRWLTRAQAEALIKAARSLPRASWLLDFIMLGLNTGMRRGEMLGLEWRRVDLASRLLYLESEHQKNGKVGSVPLNEAATTAILSRARFLANRCPDAPWVFCDGLGRRIQDVKKSFATACKLAGIDDFHVHDLRHTCASWLVQAGVPLQQVAGLLRHSDIRVTMRYAHLAPENVRAAVAVLDGLKSRSGHADRVENLGYVG